MIPGAQDFCLHPQHAPLIAGTSAPVGRCSSLVPSSLHIAQLSFLPSVFPAVSLLCSAPGTPWSLEGDSAQFSPSYTVQTLTHTKSQSLTSHATQSYHPDPPASCPFDIPYTLAYFLGTSTPSVHSLTCCYHHGCEESGLRKGEGVCAGPEPGPWRKPCCPSAATPNTEADCVGPTYPLG